MRQLLLDFAHPPPPTFENFVPGRSAAALAALRAALDATPDRVIYVWGEAGAGKTSFLQLIALALSRTHQESELQYGVTTSRVEEWDKVKRKDHGVGVFEADQKGAQDFVLSPFMTYLQKHLDETKQAIVE